MDSTVLPNSLQKIAPTKALSALDRIKQSGIVRAGFTEFSPYTIVDRTASDPKKQIKGFAVDLVQEIVDRTPFPLKIEWHRCNYDTINVDIQSGRFDFVADPVYCTVPRALEFGFTEPYSYFGIAVGLVKKEDNRFARFEDLDRSDITIAVGAGWTSTEFAMATLKGPSFRATLVRDNALSQLEDLLSGRADIVLQDTPTICRSLEAHPNTVRALWLDKPPSMVPGGFAAAKQDADLIEFLSACIRIFKADGTIARLDKKWNTYGYLDQQAHIPTNGLQKLL